MAEKTDTTDTLTETTAALVRYTNPPTSDVTLVEVGDATFVHTRIDNHTPPAQIFSAMAEAARLIQEQGGTLHLLYVSPQISQHNGLAVVPNQTLEHMTAVNKGANDAIDTTWEEVDDDESTDTV